MVEINLHCFFFCNSIGVSRARFLLAAGLAEVLVVEVTVTVPTKLVSVVRTAIADVVVKLNMAVLVVFANKVVVSVIE